MKKKIPAALCAAILLLGLSLSPRKITFASQSSPAAAA